MNTNDNEKDKAPFHVEKNMVIMFLKSNFPTYYVWKQPPTLETWKRDGPTQNDSFQHVKFPMVSMKSVKDSMLMQRVGDVVISGGEPWRS